MDALYSFNRSGPGLLNAAPLSALAGGPAAPVGLEFGRSSVCLEPTAHPGPGIALCGTDEAVINAGAGLAGGELAVLGSTGPNAGRGMAAGTLRVLGSAGPSACAKMQGGLAVFEGSVAGGFGRSMRRGVAVVHGRAQGAVLEDMRGGTVLLLGGLESGATLCRGMNRGTVLLPSKELVPGWFEPAADVDLAFLRLLFLELVRRGVQLPKGWLGSPFTRWRGDVAALGKGEIFTPCGGSA